MAKKSDFILTLELGGKQYKGKGPTIEEALFNLEKPPFIKNKGILYVEHEGKKTHRLMWPMRLKRFFYRSAQPVLAKQLLVGLR